MTEEQFMTLPFAEAAAGQDKSIARTFALGFDQRGTGALVKLLRDGAASAQYFIPSPVTVEFGRNCNEIGKKLGYNGHRIEEVPLLEPEDWNNSAAEMVFGIRVEYFPQTVIIGLHLGGGVGHFFQMSGDLAKALADTFLDEHDNGTMVDLRSVGDAPRPQ